MLTFAAAVFFLIITPGPGVMTTAGVGAGFGAKAGTHYVLGLFIGTNLVALAVITGLAAIVLAEPRLRLVLAVGSTAYLLYLAAKIAFAGAKVAFIAADRPPGVSGGILLQFINPKAYVVNTTLFSGFPFLPGNLAVETLLKLLIMNAIWVPIHFLWLGAGIWLNQLDLPPVWARTINVAMAAAMLMVVALAGLGLMGGRSG